MKKDKMLEELKTILQQNLLLDREIEVMEEVANLDGETIMTGSIKLSLETTVGDVIEFLGNYQEDMLPVVFTYGGDMYIGVPLHSKSTATGIDNADNWEAI